MKHRALNRTIANTLGYFWLPCPLCGQEYGGHEHMQIPDGVIGSIPAPDGPQGTGLCICPDCALAGKGRLDPFLYGTRRADEIARPDNAEEASA